VEVHARLLSAFTLEITASPAPRPIREDTLLRAVLGTAASAVRSRVAARFRPPPGFGERFWLVVHQV
jgi:hypothetical protein